MTRLVPMENKMEGRSPTAHDIELVVEDMAIVVELKVIDGVVASQWWVTGLTEKGSVALLLQLQLGLAGKDEASARNSCQVLMPVIVQLAKSSASAGGLNVPLVLPHAWNKSQFALAHLRLLDVAGVIKNSSVELAQQTALQYQLANALGVTKQVELLAEHLGVPVSTVRRRLAKARDQGFLSKKRDLKKAGSTNG